MPASQHHNHNAYPVVPRTPSPDRITKLARSADRHCKTPPALLMVSRQTQPKKLRWAPGIVDNETRAKAMPVVTGGSNPSSHTKSSPNTSVKRSPSRHQSLAPNQRHQTSPSNLHPRRDSSRSKSSYTIPPRVPDAPRPKPPPAPRPARLPTPDLPEIDGDFFFPATQVVKKIVPNYSKMDAQCTFPFKSESWQSLLTETVEAAMAYMNQGKKRR